MKKIYIVEYWETGEEKHYFFGVYKRFKKAKKDVETLDTNKYSWSIDERRFGKYDPRKNDRVAFSRDFMAGDTLVKAGTLFPKYGASISCAKMAYTQRLKRG